MARSMVEITATQLDGPEDGLYRLGPVGVTLFPGAAPVLSQAGLQSVEQLLQQPSPILQQGSAQPQLDGLQVAHSLPRKVFSYQPQERFGFPESLRLDFGGLEFFLPSSAS